MKLIRVCSLFVLIYVLGFVPGTMLRAQTFSGAADMAQYRTNHTATRLPDGSVLIVGGFDQNYQTTNIVELYSEQYGTYTQVAHLSQDRARHTANLITDSGGNSYVLIAGGVNNDRNALNTVEIYNVTTGTMTSAPSMPEAHSEATGTTVYLGNGDQAVLVMGGVTDHTGDVTTATELYDINTNSWTPGTLLDGRAKHKATMLNSGLVLVTGGYNITGADISSAELFDPNTNSSTRTSDLLLPRESHISYLLGDGTVLIAGGFDGNSYSVLETYEAEIYNPSTGSFVRTANMNRARTQADAVDIAGEYFGGLRKIMVIGGGQGSVDDPDASFVVKQDADIYDPINQTWTLSGSMYAPRESLTATDLYNGNVLITGGMNALNSNNRLKALKNTEIYTPVE